MKELVKKLRDLTKASMNDCVLALKESENDFDKALDLIKIKGQNIVTGNKVAAEGLVVLKKNSNSLTLLEFSCQTDFVANSEDFKEFTNKVLSLFKDGDLDLSNQEYLDLQKDIQFKTKESCSLKRFKTLKSDGYLAHYIHTNNKVGCLVKFENKCDVADDIAMQIVAMNPLSVYKENLPEDVISKQKEIFLAQVKEMNKPESSWGKILDGKLNKWFSEVCLINQKLITNDSKTLKDVLSNNKIIDFVRFEVGEGVVVKSNYLEDVSKLL